ncbi:MAG: hypothetical protein AB7F86_05390 [Bdellovibrionales bacterium]
MILLFALLFTPSSWSAEKDLRIHHPEWVILSRQLIGESEKTRQKALTQLLETFPTTKDILKEIDGPYRPYALDVLVALNRPDTALKLLDLVASDPDGSLTLAINALMNGTNYLQIAERYEKLLSESLGGLSTPSALAMMDYLTHLKRPCPDDICEKLLAHSRIELQQAAALHLAAVPKANGLEILARWLDKLYPQVRAQIMLVFYDRSQEKAEKICLADKDPIVQSACGDVTFVKPDKVKSKEKRKKKSKKAQRKIT